MKLKAILVKTWILLVVHQDVVGSANPVILLHGIMDNYKTVASLGDKISRDIPGTETFAIQVSKCS